VRREPGLPLAMVRWLSPSALGWAWLLHPISGVCSPCGPDLTGSSAGRATLAGMPPVRDLGLSISPGRRSPGLGSGSLTSHSVKDLISPRPSKVRFSYLIPSDRPRTITDGPISPTTNAAGPGPSLARLTAPFQSKLAANKAAGSRFRSSISGAAVRCFARQTAGGHKADVDREKGFPDKARLLMFARSFVLCDECPSESRRAPSGPDAP